ncbi:TRAP transporter solute receptor, TAXI family [Caldalkalibacillus thermarum TA2.A1]|uniref:TAXI family TRAP transporter solute-binding subunit n=1 Tax=Caldalkalibacillus thermarum (strain TA2.A1) TaxID=986075 RepID=F5L615_CALTT|nr:TAXI family TRAP transporter solute-binding subunit [Caldalkalibacillus thermarum]EGL83218.1 TRAP transporter solute receptor, TAXI family [Caldalkalibacillus thermarum TA2.A1]QZT34813.1 TAXI family TRAP transporter solute-binding subunit [Caldalkalibacillus thermarum TA2.A1]
MKNNKKWWAYGLMILALVLLAACSAETGSDGEEAQEEDIQEMDYPSSVIIGTASQGGTYFIYGGGLATLLEEHLGVTANVEVTGGPVHNMQLVQAKDQEIGLVTLGPAYEGYTGTGEWTGGEKYEDVRIIFPMYSTPFHWWALADTGIEHLDDIKGKRVGVGPAGGTSGTYLPMIHDLLGLDTQNVQAGASDMASQMLDGQLDIIGFAAGIPIAAVTEVEAQRDINIFGIDGEYRQRVIEEFPYFYEFTIPADTYDSLDHDVETIAMFNFGIAHKEINADFIYDFVKAYHENIEQLIQTHSSAEEAVPEAILFNTDVPLHVGAIRYYEEIGIDLPESVYPPEWNE